MVVVRTARAEATVHASKHSLSGRPGGTRWSMSQTDSKPSASATSVRSRIVSHDMRIWGRNNPKPSGAEMASVGTAGDASHGGARAWLNW